MIQFDRWLFLYTSFGFGVVLIAMLLFLYPSFRPRRPWLWAVGLVGLLLGMRLPFIAYNRELEIDESQMLTQAMSLLKYGAYWKDVDGLTQGPLVSYLLIIPSWLGLPFDYMSARLVGFGVLSLTLLLTYLTFKNLFGIPVGRALFVPIAFLYLLGEGRFCVLYNEYVVLGLLAASFWLFSIAYTQEAPGLTVLFALGLVSGLIPLAKLQGMPTALVTLAFTGLLVLSRSSQPIRSLVLLLVGGGLVPLGVLVTTVLQGTFDYVWHFYLLGNFQYSAGGSIGQKALNFPDFVAHSGAFANLFYSYGLLIVGAVGWLIWSKPARVLPNGLVGFGLIHTLAGFYAAIKSGYQFDHYLQFLIIPLGLLSGALWQRASSVAVISDSRVRWGLMSWCLLCFLPYGVSKWVLRTDRPAAEHVIGWRDLAKPLPVSPQSRAILTYTRPGDDLAMWGWDPAYHLETKLTQATADNITYRALTPGPLQRQHQMRWLSDLQRHRPAVFVDLINSHSFWFKDPARYSHEQVPAVGAYIRAHYQLVATIDDERIYVRKDRLAVKGLVNFLIK